MTKGQSIEELESDLEKAVKDFENIMIKIRPFIKTRSMKRYTAKDRWISSTAQPAEKR
jgi:hypothetical protein